MTFVVRKASDRGTSRLDWLDSRHTFSFSHYHDPRFMGFRSLRVINDDTVVPGKGFGTHSHRDMEILTYVLEGALEHRDSIGTGSVIRPGDVQKMSAGTGIAHSEFNHSPTEPVHFLQIWVIPARAGLEPAYEQVHVPAAEKAGTLRLIAGPRTATASPADPPELVHVEQDLRLYATVLGGPAERVEHRLAAGRYGWLHVARGSILLGDRLLHAGDGAALAADRGPETFTLSGVDGTSGEVLLFDLA